MKKATATYVAPEGDNKVVEMGGVTFFDGKSVDLNSFDHEHLISKLANNQHFDIEVGEDDGKVKRKPGRPPKVKPAETKLAETKQTDKAQASSAQTTDAT